MIQDLAISPAGRAYLESAHTADTAHDAAAHAVPAAAAARIARAFGQSGAQGLLQLGAVELGLTLPPSLAFGREFAHRFLAQYTAVASVADEWATVELPAPQAELAQLAAAAPPMTGAEYLDADVLAAWLQGKHPSWSLVGRVCLHLAENKSDERAPSMCRWAGRCRAIPPTGIAPACSSCCCRCTRRPNKARGSRS